MIVLKNTNKYIITLTMLFQSLVIFVLIFLIFNSVTLSVIKKSIIVFDIVIITTILATIFTFISLRKFSYYEKKEAEFKLIKANMNSTEELINLLNSQRLEYLTHIQSIGALVYLEEYEELSKYLKGISKNYRFNGGIIRIGHPALTALINAKREIAREKNIFFYTRIKQKLNCMNIPSWDLCILFSNLIENAIEAASMTEGKKWMKVVIDYYNNNFVFEIENTGQMENNIMKNLFKQGNTSKSSSGRGYGLYISKKILDKYNGSIDIKNTDIGTVLCTLTLPREAGNYNEEVS